MKKGDLLTDSECCCLLLLERRAYAGTWYWYVMNCQDRTGGWAPNETLKRLYSIRIESLAQSSKVER